MNLFQDGTEQRMIESLSLIDAVMPDIVASRQQAQVQQQSQQQTTGTATKGPPGLIKNDPQETNGEEGIIPMSIAYCIICIVLNQCMARKDFGS